MQRERGDGGVGIGVFPSLGRDGVVDGQKLNKFQPNFFAPLGERFQIGKLADTETFLAAQTENGNGHARAVPSVRREHGKAVVHDDVLVARRRCLEQSVIAAFKTNEGVILDVEDAVFINERKWFAAQIELHGEEVFAGLACEQNGRSGLPVAEVRAFAEQAERLSLGQQRRFDADCVRGFRCGRRGNFGEIFREQNFFEWLGVKGVGKKAGVIPRIQHEQIGRLEVGRSQRAVLSPVGSL